MSKQGIFIGCFCLYEHCIKLFVIIALLVKFSASHGESSKGNVTKKEKKEKKYRDSRRNLTIFTFHFSSSPYWYFGDPRLCWNNIFTQADRRRKKAIINETVQLYYLPMRLCLHSHRLYSGTSKLSSAIRRVEAVSGDHYLDHCPVYHPRSIFHIINPETVNILQAQWISLTAASFSSIHWQATFVPRSYADHSWNNCLAGLAMST